MRLTIFLFVVSFAIQLNAQTTVTIRPNAAQGKDAQVWDFAPNQNRSSIQDINIYTWTRSGNPTVKRSYIEFDLSAIPANAIVQTAKLKLFYDPLTNESFTTHSGVTEFEIRRVTSSWLENTISWGSQPSVSNLNKVDVPAHTSGTQNYSIEVGNLVNDMLQNSNHGFQLRMKNETNPQRGLLFASSDHSNSNLHPELEITYTLPNMSRAFVAKDAPIWSHAPTNNYGSNPNLVAYTYQSGNIRLKRIFIEFDLTSIPSGAKLDSAFMNLYFATAPNEGFGHHVGGTDLEINRVIMPWQDSTINWSNQPSVAPIPTLNVPQHQSQTQDYRINVTNLVAAMRQYGNNGFRIKMQNEQVAFRGVLFASAEHANSNLHPNLEVYWTLPTNLDKAAKVEHKFELYPNPSEGIVNLNVNDLNKVEQIQIYDSRGKLMRSFNRLQSNSLDLNEMANGLYFMRVQFNSGDTLSKKFILK